MALTTNWFGAGRAIGVPVLIPRRRRIKQIGWYNGTAVSGSVDAGFYTLGLRKIVSTGATAQAGTSQWQWVDITDFDIGPGVYYFVISHSATGRLAYVSTSVQRAEMAGLFEVTSANPLPDTISPVLPSSALWPMVSALLDDRIA